MSFGSRSSTPSNKPQPAGIEDETLSNTQEAVPIPVHMGTRKITARWISPIYDQRAVQKEEKVK
jgi:hypothetical protein